METEFGLIERLREVLGEPGEGEIWIGDDAAVLRAPAGTILFAADMMVEGVHFDLSLTGPRDLGYKAIAVNISDIAAMGGTPRRATICIGIKRGIEPDWIVEMYRGMRECADAFGMAVVGGDISRSDCLTISVALLGNPAGRLTIQRSGARLGDVVAVTGTLGASAAGYRLLRAGMRERDDLRMAHLRPTPRAREVQILRRSIPSAMIDVSDGFAADLGHICEASGVGAEIDAAALPIADLEGLGLDRDALDLALHGGEDYELCFTIDASRFDAAASAVTAETGTKVTAVGKVIEGQGLTLIDGSERKRLEPRGWDHLSY